MFIKLLQLATTIFCVGWWLDPWGSSPSMIFLVFYTCTYLFVSLVEAIVFFLWNCSSDSFIFHSHFKHAEQLSGYTIVGNRIQIFGHKSYKIFIETQIWMHCFSCKHNKCFFFPFEKLWLFTTLLYLLCRLVKLEFQLG